MHAFWFVPVENVPSAHGLQTESAVGVASFSKNVPALQATTGLQNFMLAASCHSTPTSQAAHSRFDELVGATVCLLPGGHSATGVHSGWPLVSAKSMPTVQAEHVPSAPAKPAWHFEQKPFAASPRFSSEPFGQVLHAYPSVVPVHSPVRYS